MSGSDPFLPVAIVRFEEVYFPNSDSKVVAMRAGGLSFSPVVGVLLVHQLFGLPDTLRLLAGVFFLFGILLRVKRQRIRAAVCAIDKCALTVCVTDVPTSLRWRCLESTVGRQLGLREQIRKH